MTDGNELIERWKREESFHDEKYADHELFPRHYELDPTGPIFEDLLSKLSEVSTESDQRILEYGCGEGWTTVRLMELGARVDAFDISEQAIGVARERVAEIGGADSCTISKMAAEKLEYPDNHFDCAVGFAILHHLNLDDAIPELHRVLKPGGRGLFAEPLGTNPLINAYRRRTPQFRTVDEEPLIFSTFNDRLKDFSSVKYSYYYFFALASLGLGYIPGVGKQLFNALNPGLMKLDEKFLKNSDTLGKFSWYTIVEVIK